MEASAPSLRSTNTGSARRPGGQPSCGKLALTRSEEIAATTPAPPLEVKLKLGARKDGTLTALQTDVTMDAGCYPMNLASFVGYQVGNYYPVPNMEIRVREALTFKPSAGA